MLSQPIQCIVISTNFPGEGFGVTLENYKIQSVWYSQEYQIVSILLSILTTGIIKSDQEDANVWLFNNVMCS